MRTELLIHWIGEFRQADGTTANIRGLQVNLFTLEHDGTATQFQEAYKNAWIDVETHILDQYLPKPHSFRPGMFTVTWATIVYRKDMPGTLSAWLKENAIASVQLQ